MFNFCLCASGNIQTGLLLVIATPCRVQSREQKYIEEWPNALTCKLFGHFKVLYGLVYKRTYMFG